MSIERYNYNGFTYLKNYDTTIKSQIIEYEKEKPEHIFKFYALSKFSVDALVNGYFYASHPIELNDLLDSSPFLFYTSKKIDYELYEKFFGVAYDDKEQLKKYYEEDSNRENLCKGYISTLWETATNLFGIISTTGKEFNTLMWPHYTQEKGFQIKFKTEKLEKSIESKITEHEEYLGLYPVNYTQKLSPIDVSPFKTLLVPLYYVTNIKSNDWEYENEWRFLIGKQNMGVPYSKKGLDPRKDYSVDKKNRYVYYDKNLVEEITLGVDFFNGRDFEIEWLDDKNFKVKPIESDNNWEFKSLTLFMDYVCENHNDKLYYSGIKYELDEENIHYIIRTKEKLEIQKLEDSSFILTRTNIIIK